MRPLGTTAHEIVHSPSSVSEQAAGRAGDVIENAMSVGLPATTVGPKDHLANTLRPSSSPPSSKRLLWKPTITRRLRCHHSVNLGSVLRDEPVVAQTSSPETSPIAWQPQQTGIQPHGPDEPSNIFVFNDGTFDQGESLPVDTCHTGTAGSLDLPPRRTSYSSPARVPSSVGSRPGSNALFPAAPGDPGSSMTDRPVSSEMSLLRYYRYQVSPLLDVGDPWCSFSVKVPMLAGSEASLRHAILALAARHRALRTQSNTIGHVEDTICPQQEIDQILLPKENPLWHVRQSLLLFRDFSCFRPHQWRDFVTQRLLFQEIVSLMPTQQDLTNSAFWLLVKMDIAASLMSRTPLSITVPLAGLLSIPREGDRRYLLRYVYLSSVILLAKVLDLIYTQPGKPRSEHSQAFTDSVFQELVSRSTRGNAADNVCKYPGSYAHQPQRELSSSYPYLLFALGGGSKRRLPYGLLLPHDSQAAAVPSRRRRKPGSFLYQAYPMHCWHRD
ncbi:unnamed protein product, partial [Clonostachys chloroleuca]